MAGRLQDPTNLEALGDSIRNVSCFFLVVSKLLCRDLLNSEGLIDLLSTASGQQTGRCVSLPHPLKMATDYEIIVQAIISLL